MMQRLWRGANDTALRCRPAAAAPPFAQPPTSASSDKDWMFCPISGYLMELDPMRGVAHCPMTGYQKSLDGALQSSRCPWHLAGQRVATFLGLHWLLAFMGAIWPCLCL